jgi:hypothetical protein
VRRNGKGPRLDPVRARVRAVPAWVRPELVERGVDFTCAAFQGPLFVPSELLEP